MVGYCWAQVRALGHGPKSTRGSVHIKDRPYQARNVQLALRELETAGYIFPYANGPARTIAYMVFAEPLSEETLMKLWRTTSESFARRMRRSVVDIEQGPDLALGAQLEEAEAACSELAPLTPSERWVYSELRKMVVAKRQNLAPLLNIEQHAVLKPLLQEFRGRTWTTIRFLTAKADADEPEAAHRTVQVALRGIEARGLVVPYAEGPCASVAYLVFDKPIPRAAVSKFWAAADEDFKSKMARSCTCDRPKNDQEIAPTIFIEDGNLKQPNPSAAAVSVSASLDGGPSPPNPPQPHHTEDITLSLGDIERFCGLSERGQAALTELQRRLYERTIHALNKLGADHSVVDRWLHANKAEDLTESLALCAAQAVSIAAMPTRPRKPSAYFATALAARFEMATSPTAIRRQVERELATPAERSRAVPAAPKPVQIPAVSAAPQAAQKLSPGAHDAGTEKPSLPQPTQPMPEQAVALLSKVYKFFSPETWIWRTIVDCDALDDRVIFSPASAIPSSEFPTWFVMNDLPKYREVARDLGLRVEWRAA